MSNAIRRTALSLLGLAPAAALAGEDLSRKLDSGGPSSGYRFGVSDKTSAALRKLADDIDARASLVQGMNLNSKVSHEDFLTHTLTIEFVLSDIDAADRI